MYDIDAGGEVDGIPPNRMLRLQLRPREDVRNMDLALFRRKGPLYSIDRLFHEKCLVWLL